MIAAGADIFGIDGGSRVWISRAVDHDNIIDCIGDSNTFDYRFVANLPANRTAQILET